MLESKYLYLLKISFIKMFNFILLFVSLLFVCSIKAQINLNRSNLAKVCSCNIFDSQIILDNKNISTIDENTFIGLSNLTVLSFNQNFIKSIQANTFNGLVNLTYLDLSNNQIELIEDETFKDLSSLKTLDIQLNRIESINLSDFKGLINLQYL